MEQSVLLTSALCRKHIYLYGLVTKPEPLTPCGPDVDVIYHHLKDHFTRQQ